MLIYNHKVVDIPLTNNLHVARAFTLFQMFVNKEVTDGGSDKPKYVAQCCITLKCYVWWSTLYVSGTKRTLDGIARSLLTRLQAGHPGRTRH